VCSFSGNTKRYRGSGINYKNLSENPRFKPWDEWNFGAGGRFARRHKTPCFLLFTLDNQQSQGYIQHMTQELRHKNTSISLVNYHFVWIPKRRRPVLSGPVADRLIALVREKCKELGLSILAFEIQPDHVHLFVNAPPSLAPDQIMFRLKGYSSRMLRKEFPFLLRMPSMWTRSFFVSTAGNVSSETIKKYIEAQSKSA
jgi:putative transposase